MITSLFYMTVKPGHTEAFRKLVTQAVTTTHAEDAGCITYVFHQQQDNPTNLSCTSSGRIRPRSMPI
jgi:quinol monooxygenase YgiN